MNRAYSILTAKAVQDGDERVIRGIATTPTPDRVGDVVEPLGVKFNNPMPLLHQHDHERPVGTVMFEAPTESGIAFEARLPSDVDDPTLKARIDLAWAEVKAGLVRAVSIGFRVLNDNYEVMRSGGLRFKETEVMELSLVTIPANADATISYVKSLDRAVRGQPDSAPAPATTGTGAAAKRKAGVVRLSDPARDRAKPFVIRRIHT